jgi:hypothetical protein
MKRTVTAVETARAHRQLQGLLLLRINIRNIPQGTSNMFTDDITTYLYYVYTR